MQENSNDTMLICPLCKKALNKEDNRFVCENSHNFDCAKQGYVNLLPVQNKKSKNPGDNKAMISCRKAFMEKTYYDFLLAPCVQLIAEYIDKSPEKAVLLDIGCGDGYFTDKLFSLHADTAFTYGMDISKEAVKVAAKRNKNINWFVASSSDIPLVNNCVDVLLKINAPLDYQHAKNKLNANGIVISITPGKNHLFELKKTIYDKPRQHEPENCPEHYNLLHSVNLQQQLELKSVEDVQNLFMMTPLFWNASKDVQQKVNELPYLDTCISFDINVWGVA